MDGKTIEDVLHHAFDYVEHHRKAFGIVLAIIFVGFAAGLGLGHVLKTKSQDAMTALYDVQVLESQAFDEQDNLVQPEKKAEIQNAYEKAIAHYGNNRSGKFLHYHYAFFLTRIGEYDKALAQYQIFGKSFTGPSPYRALILLNMAVCADELKRYEDAKNWLLEAKEIPDNPQKDLILYRLANTFEDLNQNDEAIKFYDELVREYSGSPFAVRARERKNTLQFGTLNQQWANAK